MKKLKKLIYKKMKKKKTQAKEKNKRKKKKTIIKIKMKQIKIPNKINKISLKMKKYQKLKVKKQIIIKQIMKKN